MGAGVDSWARGSRWGGAISGRCRSWVAVLAECEVMGGCTAVESESVRGNAARRCREGRCADVFSGPGGVLLTGLGVRSHWQEPVVRPAAVRQGAHSSAALTGRGLHER